MQTKTLNVVVREHLLNEQLPLHYYLPYLHHAIKCFEDLEFDFSFFNIKEAKAVINSHDRFAIPLDVADVVSVYGLYHGREKPFALDTSLTKNYNLEGAVKKSWSDSGSTIPGFIEMDSSYPLDNIGTNGLQTILSPSRKMKYAYNVDLINNEILLRQGHECTDIYIKYLTSTISVSAANVVPLYWVPVIHSYIRYMVAEGTRQAQSQIARLRSYYYNDKKNLRARVNPLTISTLYDLLADV